MDNINSHDSLQSLTQYVEKRIGQMQKELIDELNEKLYASHKDVSSSSFLEASTNATLQVTTDVLGGVFKAGGSQDYNINLERVASRMLRKSGTAVGSAIGDALFDRYGATPNLSSSQLSTSLFSIISNSVKNR